MYTKLILKNAKRSINDYLIYIITMIVCVMLFYAFLSIASKYYKPDVGSEYSITLLSDGLKTAICAVTLLLLFLINYVNKYMLIRKQREFAILSVMGMEKSTVAGMFFLETIIMGAVSIVIGIILGTFCSQAITAMLLSAYGLKYQFVFGFFPDTVVMTILFFTISFLVIGLSNVRTIRKIKIIDMLHVEQYNEPQVKRGRYMRLLYVFYLIFLIYLTFVGIKSIKGYADSRYPFIVHIMFALNVIVPLFTFICAPIWFVKKKKTEFNRLIFTTLIMSLVNTLSLVFSIVIRGEFFIMTEGDDTGKLFIYVMIHLMFFVCCSIYLSSNMIVNRKEKSLEYKYKNCNLFFFGQIISKLNTTTKTMTLICLTLFASIMLFVSVPALIGWMNGYLDVRSLYDVQINTKYNNVYNEKDLASDDYEILTDYFSENGIDTDFDKVVKLYLPLKDEFSKRQKLDFPILAIALSDYNSLRKVQGLEPISLNDDEFAVQWQTTATKKYREDFWAENKEVHSDAGTLKISKNPEYDDAIGETLYNTYTDAVYVFPDSVCDKLLSVKCNRYVVTREPVSYGDAVKIEELFNDKYKSPDDKEGVTYQIKTATVQKNSVKASSFVLRATLTYCAVVLMVICLTILSLQQLMDVPYYRYRFGVLDKIGVDEKQINGLIIKQLSVWFGLPVSVAFLVSIIGCASFLMVISEQIAAYMGFGVLLHQVVGMVAIFACLLVGYYISTLHLLNGSIKQKE